MVRSSLPCMPVTPFPPRQLGELRAVARRELEGRATPCPAARRLFASPSPPDDCCTEGEHTAPPRKPSRASRATPTHHLHPARAGHRQPPPSRVPTSPPCMHSVLLHRDNPPRRERARRARRVEQPRPPPEFAAPCSRPLRSGRPPALAAPRLSHPILGHHRRPYRVERRGGQGGVGGLRAAQAGRAGSRGGWRQRLTEGLFRAGRVSVRSVAVSGVVLTRLGGVQEPATGGELRAGKARRGEGCRATRAVRGLVGGLVSVARVA